MRLRFLLSSVFVAAAVISSGCTPNIGGQDYSVTDSGYMSQTFAGTILSTRSVVIANQSPKDQGKMGAGALVGGAAGGILAGTTIGKGNGSIAAGAIGALAGGALGHYAEKEMTRQNGVEYSIKLDAADGGEGRVISVAQGLEPRLSVGQRVTVIQGKERTRVVAL